MIFQLYLGPQKITMCILSPRDIMVVQEVFMTYLFIEKIYIQSRFSGHAISISDIVQTTILGLVIYQTLFSMTPPPMSLGDKSAVCRTLPVQLKMKQLVFAALLSKQLSSSEYLIKKITRRAAGHIQCWFYLFQK